MDNSSDNEIDEDCQAEIDALLDEIDALQPDPDEKEAVVQEVDWLTAQAEESENDGTVVELGVHMAMSPTECLAAMLRKSHKLRGVIVVGVNHDGELVLNNSESSRAQSTYLLLEAIDYIRGVRMHD